VHKCRKNVDNYVDNFTVRKVIHIFIELSTSYPQVIHIFEVAKPFGFGNLILLIHISTLLIIIIIYINILINNNNDKKKT